jgi:nicotinic acid mononucleotide adenylyltransferase
MARKIVFAWGRFNPPTTGHKVVMDRVAKEAKSRKAEYAIFASKSNDPKKNPLTFRTKIKFLKQSFPKHAKNINSSSNLKTVLDVMKFLNKKYQEVSLVVGSDRAQEFKTLLNKYNGKDYDFDEIEIISAGERDPDAEDVTGMSASKMRKFAVQGNYKEFSKGSPMKNPKPLYDAIRRGMKINEEFYGVMNELHDVTDRSVSGRRFNAMLRFGLVPTKYIPITQRAFKDLEQAAPNPELRKHILDVTDKVLEYVMADDLLYRRFLLLLHDNFLMKEEHRDGLLKKAHKNSLPYTSLLEVFLRGLAASPIYGDKTAHQHAFDRVNSYVSGGHSRKKLDADIWEAHQHKDNESRRNKMKKLSDSNPPKWGTKEMADRYSKVIPGQPNNIGEAAPPGKEAEAFIKDNKDKFKERYGDRWEQVLYATAWKVYGKNEDVEIEEVMDPVSQAAAGIALGHVVGMGANYAIKKYTDREHRKGKHGKHAQADQLKRDAKAKARRDAKKRILAAKLRKAASKVKSRLTRREEVEVDEARSAGYKMPQSKDPYTVKYAKSKGGKIQVTVVDGEKAAKKFLADVKKQGMNGIITKGGHQNEEVEQVSESKMGNIVRKVKGGASPYTVVAMVGKKVVDQDYAKVADQVPAIVSSLKKEHPKAKIGVEDRSGKMMHTEDIDVTEGGLSMIGRTKPSRELNTSRQEKPHLSGGSLKDKKRDAHKAERAKAKKQLKGFKNYK